MLLTEHLYVCIADTSSRSPKLRQHGDMILAIRVRLLERKANDPTLLMSRAEADAFLGLQDEYSVQRTAYHFTEIV